MGQTPKDSWTVGEDGRKVFSTHGIAERIVAAVPLDLSEGDAERQERARLISTAPDGYFLAEAVVLRGHAEACDYAERKVCTCLVKPAAELLLKARGR